VARSSIRRRPDNAWHLALAELVGERLRDARALASTGPGFTRKIHDTRTTLKRMRAFWKLAKPSIPGPLYRRENRRLRLAAHRLQSVRDVHVFEATLAKIAAATTGTTAAEAARLAVRLRRPAVERREAVKARAALPVVLREIDRSLAAFRALPFTDGSWIRDGVRRSFDRARKAGRLDADDADEAFHAWRKQVKVLFYQVEALAPLGRRRLARLRRGLDTLQEQLGDEHDLVVIRAAIDKRVPAAERTAASSVGAAARRLGRRLRRKALERRRRVFGPAPRRAVWSLSG
jgi:CHAD domain-containing protein